LYQKYTPSAIGYVLERGKNYYIMVHDNFSLKTQRRKRKINHSTFVPVLLAVTFRENQTVRMQELSQFWPWIVVFCIVMIVVISGIIWYVMKTGRLTKWGKIRMK
jgi:predicted Na+-dependent transporter